MNLKKIFTRKPVPVVSSPKAEPAATGTSAWNMEQVKIVIPQSAPGSVNMRSRSGVFLVPWNASYEDYFYAWRNDMRLLPLWYGDRRPVTRQHLRDEMSQAESTVFFVICSERFSEPLGFVFSLNALSGLTHADVNIFLDPKFQGSHFSTASTLLFFRYLFETFDILKVTADIYAWNPACLKPAIRLTGARVEGIRKNHGYWNGKYFDMYELAWHRKDFEILKQTSLWKRLMG